MSRGDGSEPKTKLTIVQEKGQRGDEETAHGRGISQPENAAAGQRFCSF